MHHQYHILYKTTCIVTSHYYVGMHSTNDLNDGYSGSGRILLNSIRKYGRENHIVDVLEHCQNREELTLRENVTVDDKMLADPLCMNLVRGGNTMPHEYNRNPVSAKLQAISLSRYFEEHANRDSLSKSVNRSYKRAEVRARVAKKLSEEQVIEIRRLYTLGGLTYNELGTMFGVGGTTIWMIVTYRTWKNAA